jgi:transposase-like protein
MKVSQTKLKAVARQVSAELTKPGPLVLPPVVGLKEIVRMFGVKDNTPYQWRSKGILPREDGEVSNNPVWKVTTIYAFAEETNRTIVWDPWDVLVEDEAA